MHETWDELEEPKKNHKEEEASLSEVVAIIKANPWEYVTI